MAGRHAPRVLLADEVGLGKTIEAGLILHRLLLAGRVERADSVPDSLTHQWLVELLRRFSLNVTLLDEHQSQAHGMPTHSRAHSSCWPAKGGCLPIFTVKTKHWPAASTC